MEISVVLFTKLAHLFIYKNCIDARWRRYLGLLGQLEASESMRRENETELHKMISSKDKLVASNREDGRWVIHTYNGTRNSNHFLSIFPRSHNPSSSLTSLQVS